MSVFLQLKRRFYLILVVIAALLSVILVSAYMVINRALVSDYSAKTEDIARKTINDFRIKADYVEYMSLLFIDDLLARSEVPPEAAEYEFNADVSNIKVYNSDIDGLGIFWEDGSSSVSETMYLQYVSRLEDIIKKNNETTWVIVKEVSGEKGYLFLITPVRRDKKTGFALVDATSLKNGLVQDNLFLKDAHIIFSDGAERLSITDSDAGCKRDRDTLIIDEKIRDSLTLIMEFPMTEVSAQLFKVKIYMLLFGFFFISLAVLAVWRMVNRIVGELEALKFEMDEYASGK